MSSALAGKPVWVRAGEVEASFLDADVTDEGNEKVSSSKITHGYVMY